MRINVAGRLRPFSHEAGTFVPLPGTLLQLQVFPRLIRFFKEGELVEEKPIAGSYKGFTVMLDLEAGCIKVKSDKARYFIESDGVVKEGKGPSNTRALPRLSLGSHKKLDWTLVKRRLDMREILPVWYRLGKMMPEVPGECGLLAQVDKLMAKKAREEIVPVLEELFLAGFRGIMAPRAVDDDHQGICEGNLLTGSPSVLLTLGAKIIEQLFLSFDEGAIHVLPHLPPQFFSGRFIDVPCGDLGKVNLEWSKKQARRMMLIPEREELVRLALQSKLKTFRLRNEENQSGAVFTNGAEVSLERGKRILLDRFEK